MKRLTPILAIGGKQYVMLTPQLAGLATRELGQPMGNVTRERAAIIAALDILITGI